MSVNTAQTALVAAARTAGSLYGPDGAKAIIACAEEFYEWLESKR